MIQNKALRVATGCHQKTAASRLRAETGVLPLRANLELCCQHFYASALQPLHSSHLPRPRPHTTAHSEACESEVTTLTPPPPSSSGAYWKRALTPCQTPSLWSDDRRPSGSRRPTRCLWLLPPIDPAEQMLPRSYQSVLSQLLSGHCSRLMSYRHSVVWADDPTCPDSRSTDHTVAISLAVPLIPRTWPRGICGRHPSRSLNSWQGWLSLTTCPHCRSTLTTFLHNLHSCCWPSPPFASSGTTSSSSSHPSPHFISPVVRGSLPPSANQQQQPSLRGASGWMFGREWLPHGLVYGGC